MTEYETIQSNIEFLTKRIRKIEVIIAVSSYNKTTNKTREFRKKMLAESKLYYMIQKHRLSKLLKLIPINILLHHINKA